MPGPPSGVVPANACAPDDLTMLVVMDLAIVCPTCQGAGYRVCIVGYTGNEMTGEMLVPRECEACAGTGRVLTTGWSEV